MKKKYWLKGGIIVVIIGLIVIAGVFALGYKGCLIDKYGEACMGLVLGAQLLGAPVHVFITEVLHIKLIPGPSVFYSILEPNILAEFVFVTFWSVVTNFITGTLLGWFYGLAVTKIRR